jgi:secreted PhoX family phosphatase
VDTVYEVFFEESDLTVVKKVVARPAIGAKSHEGMRFDAQGNLYSISERTPGYLFKFVPDRKGDLSSGQTYVLKVTNPIGDRTGEAQWIALDRAAVQVDASAAADLVQATGYGRPEDVEMGTARAGHNTTNYFFVSITSEHRVLRVDLRSASTAFVSEYVSRTTNATPEFEMPDNLALDKAGNLYIAEDPGGNFSSGKRKGDDIWVARAAPAGGPASSLSRFASLTDCEAEPTGIYFDILSNRLFVQAQHRGGDRLDKTMAIDVESATKSEW